MSGSSRGMAISHKLWRFHIKDLEAAFTADDAEMALLADVLEFWRICPKILAHVRPRFRDNFGGPED